MNKKITRIFARYILDSRANPTVEVELTLDDGSCEIPGCMHDCAINYDSDANIEDGTCCPCLELEYVVEDSVRNYAH